jgi:hypothetical protein
LAQSRSCTSPNSQPNAYISSLLQPEFKRGCYNC